MIKRTGCIGLCLVMVVVMVVAPVASAEVDIIPMFTYTLSIVASLGITNGTAQASGAITPYGDLETMVTVRLQRNENGTWKTLRTWVSGKVVGTSEAGGNHAVTQGYDYRVYVTGYVFDSSGVIIETVTKYGNPKSY